MFTRSRLLTICVLLLMGLMPSVPQAFAATSGPPSSLTWVDMSPMPTPRYSTSVAVSREQRIYVIGGDNWYCTPLTTVEEYAPGPNTWRARAALPTGRWGLGAATGADGRIYAIGGFGGACGNTALGTVEAYDPKSNTWTTRAPMPTPRAVLGVVAGANGKIYAVGGRDFTNNYLGTVEEYDPVSDTWTPKANMPVPQRSFGSVSASNGKIYVMGGVNVDAQAVWEFDPVADTWVQKASMPTPRDTFGAAEVKNGLIYAVGGVNGTGMLNAVDAYNPATDTWTSVTGLHAVRHGEVVAAVNKSIYAIGGWGRRSDDSVGPLGRVEAAKTPND